MNNYLTKFILICCLIVSNSTVFSQLQADFEINKFNTENKPFIEIYLKVYPNSVKYDFTGASPQCKVELTEVIKDLQTNEVVDYKKVILTNPATQDSSVSDIINQHRYSLPNGNYEVEITLDDLLDEVAAGTVKQNVTLDFPKDYASISDIEFLDSYWKSDSLSEIGKSGYEMVPLISTYYPSHFNIIAFYSELYNTNLINDPEGKFVVREFIENVETGQTAGSYSKMKKYSAAKVTPLLTAFNIESLPTGNYNVVVQIRDRNNELILEKKKNFQRVNVFVDINTTYLKDVDLKGTFIDRVNKDSIDEYIYCLRPLGSTLENNIIDNQLESMSDTLKLQYFYSFWNNRDPKDPEKAWSDYKLQVDRVEKLFGTPVKNGYQTDRGRIYLKYGAPNKVTDRPNEPSSYPYQIWQYYHIGKFNNIQFVFYLPDLITNDYMMLHSDLRGEIQNYRWQKDLQMRNSPGGNIDQTSPNGSWGSNADRYYSNP